MDQFSRSEMLLGPASTGRLRRRHVAVFGLGGVGSWAAEVLARAGVGALTLVDFGAVGITNLNRQLGALHSTIGMRKTEVMAARLRDINPDAVVKTIDAQYLAETRERFFAEPYDYILDAIDTVSCKLDLIETAVGRGIPIVSALGTGNKADASRFELCDISRTSGCPFARVMRREEGHAAGELYQTLPQQEQPEVQLRSAGLDELRFEDDETEENAEN